MQFDNLVPNWFKSAVQLFELQDDTAIFQLGYGSVTEFVSYERGVAQASAWNVHPTVDPNGLYKFTSYEINLNQKSIVVNRSTYDILSWLGDLGGLNEALVRIVGLFLKPFTLYNLGSTMLVALFKLLPQGVHFSSKEGNSILK